MFAISRAADWLKRKGLFRKISFLAAGGLITPGQMLKALALGADAVYIGTAALLAMVSDLMVEVLPFEPPTSLLVYNGKMTDQLDIEKGAKNLLRFLNATVSEMEQVAQSLGKTSLSLLDKRDLISLDPFIAHAVGVDWGWVSKERQQERFRSPEAPLPWLGEIPAELERESPPLQ